MDAGTRLFKLIRFLSAPDGRWNQACIARTGGAARMGLSKARRSLAAAKVGSATILWRQGGTGVQWALLRLGEMPQFSVFPVGLADPRGSQGDHMNPATWTYDVHHLYTGTILATDVNPVAAPHWWRRPSVGYIIPATYGYAHWNVNGELVLGWINEVADQEACGP